MSVPYLNALLVLVGSLSIVAGMFGLGGLETAAVVSGFFALLAGTALIVLTRRVADLEDRQDDREERRHERRAMKSDKDRGRWPAKSRWRRWW